MGEKVSEFVQFSDFVTKMISVPKSEILRLEAEYEKQAALNAKRRGPKKGSKRKIKSSASPAPDAA
jgi:hypothetical protein